MLHEAIGFEPGGRLQRQDCEWVNCVTGMSLSHRLNVLNKHCSNGCKKRETVRRHLQHL